MVFQNSWYQRIHSIKILNILWFQVDFQSKLPTLRVIQRWCWSVELRQDLATNILCFTAIPHVLKKSSFSKMCWKMKWIGGDLGSLMICKCVRMYNISPPKKKRKTDHWQHNQAKIHCFRCLCWKLWKWKIAWADDSSGEESKQTWPHDNMDGSHSSRSSRHGSKTVS